MSDAMKTPQRAGDSLPAWISAGIVGLALGIGGTYLVMQNYVLNKSTGAMPSAPPAGSAMMGGGGAGMGGMGMGMGGGGMGMGMGGMGGGGGGAKRNLTSLVGKLELLSRPDIKLHVDLGADQQEKIAAKLDQLAKAEKMTAEEAEGHLADLEGLLSEDQKATLGLVGLPPPARAGGGGGPPGAGGPPSAGGPPGASGPPGGGPPMGMGGMMGGGPPPDQNPFTQEANEKRLKDLISRLDPGAGEKEAAIEEKKEDEKVEGTTDTAAEK